MRRIPLAVVCAQSFHWFATPQALAEKNFSGKLVLRMTPEQHRRLAIGAMEEGVSLNRYLCARLAG